MNSCSWSRALPRERENDFFKNSEKFIDNVLKGVYIKTDYGDGTILYVDRVDLQMQFRFHYVDSLGVKLTKKTVKTLYIIVRQTVFTSTKRELFKPISLKAPTEFNQGKRNWRPRLELSQIRLQVSLQRQPCPMIKYMKSCQTTRWMPSSWLSQTIIRK